MKKQHKNTEHEHIDTVNLYAHNARYYNPEIARFLSQDPYYNLGNRVIGLYEINIPNAWSIIQANNIYVYCGNNSICFKDLLGLHMIIEAVDDYEFNTIFDSLEELTDDKIDYSIMESGAYYVWIAEETEGDVSYGTQLIRNIIQNEDELCSIITLQDNKSVTLKDNEIGVIYVGINLNQPENENIITRIPNSPFVEISNNQTPLYIILAHELIHADRIMKGTFIPYENEETYVYITKPSYEQLSQLPFSIFTIAFTNIHIRRDPEEDLITIGILPSENVITENQIRQEHGLRLRGGYGDEI